MIPAQPNRQEGQQTRARRHAEECGHANLIEPLNQQVHGNEHDRRSGCSRPARPQSSRQRGCAANIRQPGNQRRIRFRMVRNLAQAKVGVLQGHAALGNIVNQPVGRSERLIILGRGAHHAHERMGEPGIGTHGSRADARLHVNIGVGGIVDGHRLVGDIDVHRIEPIRRRHRDNRRVYVHRVRAIIEHGFRQAQREIEGVAGVLFLAVQGLTLSTFFTFSARGKLPLGDARRTARRHMCHRLAVSTHEGTQGGSHAPPPARAMPGGHRRSGYGYRGRARRGLYTAEPLCRMRIGNLRDHTRHRDGLGLAVFSDLRDDIAGGLRGGLLRMRYLGRHALHRLDYGFFGDFLVGYFRLVGHLWSLVERHTGFVDGKKLGIVRIGFHAVRRRNLVKRLTRLLSLLDLLAAVGKRLTQLGVVHFGERHGEEISRAANTPRVLIGWVVAVLLGVLRHSIP